MVLSADRVLLRDTRPPILYLRSFTEDCRLAANHNPLRVGHVFTVSFWRDRRKLSFEEVLCRGLQRVGPVIAIGRPREQLPLLGAAREYVSDGEWQDEVRLLLRTARFTCLVVGETFSLGWECNEVIRLAGPQSLLLVLPPGARDSLWESFREALDRRVAMLFPESIPEGTLAVLLRAHNRVVVVSGRHTLASYRRLGRMMARQTP